MFTVAQNIKRLRKEHGLTQQQLADSVGVHFATINRLEQGRHPKTEFGLICSIADILGVTVDSLRQQLVADEAAA